MKTEPRTPPPDAAERERALITGTSVLVQAPAGSGKTTLLADRFLALLGEVDDPSEIVAITFTKPAAAEMRNRILDALRSSEPAPRALRALERAQARGWQLLEVPGQLRIMTIDSFCRELALQQPTFTHLGKDLTVLEDATEHYRLAARRTLQRIDDSGTELSEAIATILLHRDNDWNYVETLLVSMLKQRDRWMHAFVLGRELDWTSVRRHLEKPFERSAARALCAFCDALNAQPLLRDESLDLARFACQTPGANSPLLLANCMQLPQAPFAEDLEGALAQCRALVDFFWLKNENKFRSEKGLNAALGFPPGPVFKGHKARFAAMAARLQSDERVCNAFAELRSQPPLHYSDEEWTIVRSCFLMLRHAAAELRVQFAEKGLADFTEFSQAALQVLRDADGSASEQAIAIGDGIHHLLVDEFQDTGRRQHELIGRIVGAWPDANGRSCFIVGDPMQSIYFFRDADAELFARVKALGIETFNGDQLKLDSAPLTANFRTAPELVEWHNSAFEKVFSHSYSDGVPFSRAQAVRPSSMDLSGRFHLHLAFIPALTTGRKADKETVSERDAARQQQIAEIIRVIQGHQERVEAARASAEKYRIAVLARTKKMLTPIAQALRNASIPFRAMDTESLGERQEVLDALALARAWLNPFDRVAWLGVLRAPWCGLSLEGLHLLTSADDDALQSRAIPDLIAERSSLLSPGERARVARIASLYDQRTEPQTASAGTWLEQLWKDMGGDACVDEAARSNLELLWASLDGLPNGFTDLIGTALDSVLDNLKAVPDPQTSSDCGVQLMTIHKSKGLEFEVVIMLELQARENQDKPEMLTWLERGLEDGEDSSESTEFLVAPLSTKGAESSAAKAWVDAVRQQRERDELSRLLYVGATRAREELHMFARPSYRQSAEGSELIRPTNSLLATAWPALFEQAELEFEQWRAKQQASTVGTIAASAPAAVVTLPLHSHATSMWRLPDGFEYPPAIAANARRAQSGSTPTRPLFERHDGGIASRALGNAIHVLLQEIARLRTSLDWADSVANLESLRGRIFAQIRSAGFEPDMARTLAAQAMDSAIQTTKDRAGRWLLSPHPDASSEVAWSGVFDGMVRTVRVDRVFRAAATPGEDGDSTWWIVDFKSAYASGDFTDAVREQLRSQFSPQLEAYARVLRALRRDSRPVHAALYYPRMAALDWWKLVED